MGSAWLGLGLGLGVRIKVRVRVMVGVRVALGSAAALGRPRIGVGLVTPEVRAEWEVGQRHDVVRGEGGGQRRGRELEHAWGRYSGDTAEIQRRYGGDMGEIEGR